jgi:hypothetical protein
MADLDSPPTEKRVDDSFGLFGAFDFVVHEQHHVLAQAGDDNHPEAAGEVGQTDFIVGGSYAVF